MRANKKRRRRSSSKEEEELVEKPLSRSTFFSGAKDSAGGFFLAGKGQKNQAPGIQMADKSKVSRRELKDKLRELLSVVWLNQSNGKNPIQLTPELSSALRMVSSLTEADLVLLWRPAPKNPAAVLRLISNALPKETEKSTIKKLEALRLKWLMGGMKPKTPKPKETKPGGEQESEPAKRLKGDEALFKHLVNVLKQQKPEEKDKNTEAIKKVLEAYFDTDHGKKLKEKALDYLLSKKGLPFLLIVGTQALAAMIANNTDIPSTPEIPLSDNLSLKAEFEGTFQQPKSIKLSLKFTFGGAAKEERAKAPAVLPLSKEVLAAVNRLDPQLLAKWMLKQAHEEYDKAGPDEEDRKRSFYFLVRDDPKALPETRPFARDLARKMTEAATRNRIRQLKGQPLKEKMQVFDAHVYWGRFSRYTGLYKILSSIANSLIGKVPFRGLGIKTVEFYMGKKLFPVQLVGKREPTTAKSR